MVGELDVRRDRMAGVSTSCERIVWAMATHPNAEISELAGVSEETVRRVRHGQRPSLQILAAISLLTDVNTEWLIFGTGPVFGPVGVRAAEAVASYADPLAADADGQMSASISSTELPAGSRT